MCGIIAEFNTTKNKKHKNANNFVINQYQDQYKRGQLGFGIIRINDKFKVQIDRSCEPLQFLIDLNFKKSKMIIAHHRTPTSTDNKLDQTHPILVSNKSLKYDYLVVHNGMITNTDELHTKHEELGFYYTTEYREKTTSQYGYNTNAPVTYKDKWNDTESLAIELALFIEKKISAIGLDNNAAFIVVQINKKSKKAEHVFFGKNGSCAMLNILKTKGNLQLSSEGEGEDIETNILFKFKPEDPSLKLSKIKLPFEKPVRVVPDIVSRLPATIKSSTQIVTPKDIENNTKAIEKISESIQSGTIVKLNEKAESKVTLRNWAGDDFFDKEEYLVCPLEDNKGYIDERTTEMKETIKDQSSLQIVNTIDIELESELDKAVDLLTELKNQLSIRDFGPREEMQYSSQIFRIVRAMRDIADIANEEYKEKRQAELIAESETYGEDARYYGFRNRNEMDAMVDDYLDDQSKGHLKSNQQSNLFMH